MPSLAQKGEKMCLLLLRLLLVLLLLWWGHAAAAAAAAAAAVHLRSGTSAPFPHTSSSNPTTTRTPNRDRRLLLPPRQGKPLHAKPSHKLIRIRKRPPILHPRNNQTRLWSASQRKKGGRVSLDARQVLLLLPPSPHHLLQGFQNGWREPHPSLLSSLAPLLVAM